jgi:hypothetical protein
MKHAIALVSAIATLDVLNCYSETFSAETPLTTAVEQLNGRAKLDPVGKTQPPLTVDETMTAIRGWICKQHPVPDTYYEAFQKIADTLTLPAGPRLDFTTGWKNYNGYDFVVWWVDLTLADPAGAKSERALASSYTFRIRDQKISSRAAEGGNDKGSIETRAGALPK